MCWCRPEVRTPFCGRPECHPKVKPESLDLLPDLAMATGKLIQGARVDGNQVIITVIGGNNAARLVCGALIEMRAAAREVKR